MVESTPGAQPASPARSHPWQSFRANLIPEFNFQKYQSLRLLWPGASLVSLNPDRSFSSQGLEVLAADDGPRTPDVALAMQDGLSTSGSLGLGLQRVRRIMDEFEVRSEFGKGTTVGARQWIWVSWGPRELDDWLVRLGRA